MKSPVLPVRKVCILVNTAEDFCWVEGKESFKIYNRTWPPEDARERLAGT